MEAGLATMHVVGGLCIPWRKTAKIGRQVDAAGGETGWPQLRWVVVRGAGFAQIPWPVPKPGTRTPPCEWQEIANPIDPLAGEKSEALLRLVASAGRAPHLGDT